MKTIIITAILLLTASVCYAKPFSMAYDPNSMVVVADDPNYMECTITIRITLEENAALNGLGLTLNDVIDKRRMARRLYGIIVRWKAHLIKHLNAIQLQAIIEQE